MCNIRIAAKRCSQYNFGWKQFDEQFRLKLAQSPTSSWANIDLELWLLCINQNTSNFSNRSLYKCYAFNYQGSCNRSNCTYSHSCLKCFGAHPVISCHRGCFQPRSQVRGQGVGNSFRFQTTRPRTPGAVVGQRAYTS